MDKIFSFFKHHKRVFQCAIVCALAFCVFAAVWLTQIRGLGQKSANWAINDQYHDFVPVETELVQRFTCSRDLHALSFVLAPADPQNGPLGELELVLEDASGQVLAHSVGDMQFILNGRDGYYTTLGLDVPVLLNHGPAVELTARLIPHYTGEGRLEVGFEPGGMPNGIALSADGKPVDGTVALLGIFDRVGGFVTLFYWTIAFLCIGLLGLSFWLFTSKTVPLHRLVFCLVLGLGILYNMVLPPYSVPDEKFHINQSFSLASTFYDSHLHPARTYMMENLRRPSDQGPLVQVDEPTVFTWKAYANQLTTRNHDPFGETIAYDEPQVTADYSLYWVSGFGVWLGYMLRLGFVPTLFLGRMMNLLLFAVFAALAVKKTPVAKPVFAVCALLPMTLHLAASFSRDSNLLAVCFLFIALVLDLAFGPRETLSWKQLVPIALLGIIITPGKLVYFPMLALIFLIPAVRLGKRSGLIKAAILLLCLLVFLTNSTASSAMSSFASGDNQAAEGALTEDELAGLESADGIPADAICFSLPYILHHPVKTFELCVRSVVELGDHYIRTVVGGTLGYFNLRHDLELSWGWVILLYLLLALAWLCPGGIPLSFGAKAVCLLAGLACCGLVVLGNVSWTPTYYTTIYGLQGRYFLPALPLLLLAQPKKPLLSYDCSRGIVWACGLVDVCVLLNAFLGVTAR